MRSRNIIIAVSIFFLVIGAFFLGRWTEAPKKKSVVKKQAVRPVKKKAVTVPVGSDSVRRVKVAIVIDDFGYNTNNIEAFLNIKTPMTFSILPNLRRSRDIAEIAHQHGYEAILHLPMESSRKDVTEESGTLKPGASEKSVCEQLAKDIESIPGLVGVSNHMGSKATEDKLLMTEIFRYLKGRNLYFFDSLTSEKSVCRDAAREVGIHFAQRDMFLDNSNSVSAIQSELQALKALAFKRGRAIAICHDRKNTVTALAKAMPEMEKDGIEFVYLSELVR